MSKDQKYTDVGMLIPGAPKLRAKAMVDALDFSSLVGNVADSLGIATDDVHTVTYDPEDERQHHLLEEWQQGLTKDKLWPSPPYADLMERGVPPQVIGYIKGLRDSLPRHAHRPTPDTLEAFSTLMGTARGLSDTYLSHWEKAVKPIADEPTSHSRIAQIAAFSQDLAEWKTDGSNYIYPLGITQPLSREASTAIRDGFHNAPGQEMALIDVLSAFSEYEQADRRQGTSFYVGRPSPARQSLQAIDKSGRNLRSLNRRAKASPLQVMSQAQRMLTRASSYHRAVETDNEVGYRLPFFAVLKIKPNQLSEPHPPWDKPPTPDKKKVATTAKPRRPERLSEAEAKALLRTPEDDGEDADRYQDLNALIDMGMVRGIQWGEWVPQKERAVLVKNIFDSFQHFSEAMQITPSLAGLGNPVSDEQRGKIGEDGLYESDFTGGESLGLALGARGKSAAAAHYEPGLHAINLTRLNGAGALSHEMFHGLDYKLTQLLDMGEANRQHHKSDVRKTTASKRGITTFSQLIAHHWYLKTYKSDRGARSITAAEDFAAENRKLIEGCLKFNIKTDDDLLEKIMPLMVGTAEFIREMYHQPREPEDMLERQLQQAAVSLTGRSFITDELRHDLSCITHPYSSLRSLAPGPARILSAMSELLPSDATYITDSIRRDLVEDFNREEPLDLNKLEFSDVLVRIERASLSLAGNSATQLETLLKRDIPIDQQNALNWHAHVTAEAAGLQALLFEAASRMVRDVNSPPLPDNNDVDRREALKAQVNEALSSVLATAPRSLIDKLDSAGRAVAESSVHYVNVIANLKPTAEGATAGLKEINVASREEAAPWLKAINKMENISEPFGRGNLFEAVSVLRHICDARKSPPLRELQQPCSHMLESFGLALDGFNTRTKDGLFQETPNALMAKADRLNLPEGTPHSVMARELEKAVPPHELFASLSTHARSELTIALIANAYTDSPLNDGKASSFIKVLQDPTLLGERMPSRLPEILAYLSKTDHEIPDVDDSADWHSPDTIRLLASSITEQSQRGLISRAVILAGKQENDTTKLPWSKGATDDMVEGIILDSIHHKDTRHLEALENAVSDVGASFRYLSAEERCDVISSFFDNSDQVKGLLSKDHFINNMQSPSPSRLFRRDSSPECVATKIIQLSQSLSGGLRKSRGLSNSVDRLEDAKRILPRLAISMRAPSDTLLHSASYDDVGMKKDPFMIAPGSKRGYWYSAVEMFARCSEAALHDTLESKGISSPYLVTVPSKTRQNAVLTTSAAEYPGKSPLLNYPAGSERESFALSFQKNVIPNMETALNALFPDAKPAYEAYCERSVALEERASMIQRLDAEPDERMLTQGQDDPVPAAQYEQPAPAPEHIDPAYTEPDVEPMSPDPGHEHSTVDVNQTPSLF